MRGEVRGERNLRRFNGPSQRLLPCATKLVRLLNLVLFMTTARSLCTSEHGLRDSTITYKSIFALRRRPLIDVSTWMCSVVIRMIMKTL